VLKYQNQSCGAPVGGFCIILFVEGVMAYKISDACVSCGSCGSTCPFDAISDATGVYAIDPNACVDCGSCAGSCPVDAISAE